MNELTELITIAFLSGGAVLVLYLLSWARRDKKDKEIDHAAVTKTLYTLLVATSGNAVIISKVDGGGTGKNPDVGKNLSSMIAYEAFSKGIQDSLAQDEKPASYIGIKRHIPEKDIHMLVALNEKGFLRRLVSDMPDELVMCQGALVSVPGKLYAVCTHCGRKGDQENEGDDCREMIDQKEQSRKLGILRSDIYEIDVQRPGAFYYLIIMYQEEEDKIPPLIATLLAQHRELESLAEQVRAAMESRDPIELTKALTAFRVALIAHLKVEDSRLYPALRQASDKSDLVNTYQKNMMQIGDSLRAFFDKYAEPVDDFDAFEREWSMAQQLLAHRIKSEEDVLYPLYQAVKEDVIQRCLEDLARLLDGVDSRFDPPLPPAPAPTPT